MQQIVFLYIYLYHIAWFRAIIFVAAHIIWCVLLCCEQTTAYQSTNGDEIGNVLRDIYY